MADLAKDKLDLPDSTDGIVAARWAGATLRRIHAIEMFGDCVEDGQRFPCRTIQVLNVHDAHQPETSGMRSTDPETNGDN